MDRTYAGLILFRFKRIAVIDYPAVLKLNDPRRVFFRKLGVVRDHDNKTVLCDLFEQVHNLDAGLGIKRARRLVSEKDIRIVYKSSRDRDSLHLAAGHLIRLLMRLFAESDLFESIESLLPAFSFGNA